MNSHVAEIAYGLGYTVVATSKERINSWSEMTLPGPLHRVNVRQHFSLGAFRQIIEGHPQFYVQRQIRSAMLALPKLLCR
jgi:hypothetical protein